jgi:hypothetical protein
MSQRDVVRFRPCGPESWGKLRAMIGSGIWENEYVKEDGKWKILKIFRNEKTASPLEEWWVKTPYLTNFGFMFDSYYGYWGLDASR